MNRLKWNKTIVTLVLMALLAPALKAQSIEDGTGEIEHAGEEVQLDSDLFGRDIFSALPEQVVVRQSAEVRTALNNQIARHAGRDFNGFRIRLYFASTRTAREESASVIRRFNAMYPQVQAYRTYASPNFKVTVGNFRTRLDAEAFLRKIKGDFPDAFIVRERFKYPSVGRPEDASLATVEQ